MSASTNLPAAKSVFRRFIGGNGGNVAMITALAAIPLLASVGIAVDYVRGVRAHSEIQQVADAAALAAAAQTAFVGTTTSARLVERQNVATAYLTNELAKVQDIEIVSKSATAGPNTVDVTVSAKVKGSFLNVLNALPSGGTPTDKDIDLSIHSKVGYKKDSYICLLSLNPSASEAIYFQGNSEFMASCGVQSNSNSNSAIKTWGNAYAEAESFCAVGGWVGSGFSPDPSGCSAAMTDPYASIVMPTVGACTYTNKQVKSTTSSLTAGTYCGGLDIRTHGVANLAPGLYIIKDGQLAVDSNSTLSAPVGVVFYLTGNSTYVNVQSGATLTIKAPIASSTVTSTLPYKGMAIMQDKTTGVGNTNYLYSKGGVNIEGAWYAPNQKLVVWANGDLNPTSSYFPMIVDTLNMNGTATLYVKLDYSAAGYAEPTQLKQNSSVLITQ